MADIRRALCAAVLACGLTGAGVAQAPDGPQPAPVIAAIKAHPALWVVHSKTAAAWLFGSIHLLPPNIDWHSAAIDSAMAASDIFVFEAPLDDAGQQETQAFVQAHGMLPPDVALPSLLDAQASKDYRAALASSHVPPSTLVHLRPWLAAIVLATGSMQNAHYSPAAGVDRQIYTLAIGQRKQVDTFETVDQQLALLMPKDTRLEVEEFDASLKELTTGMGQVGELVDAWSEGRTDDVARQLNAGLADTPGAMKLLIYDRNARWAERMAAMLATHHTYFVTVGAGHLAGPRGLPALLAARGYRVERTPPNP